MVPAATTAETGAVAIRSLLGDTLLSGNSEVSVGSVSGAGKYLALYFSAHWCSPCRSFTPSLCTFYQQFKATHPQADNFDIVFVSSDNDEAQFSKYFATMPFKALPYKDRELKKKLSQRFKVRSHNKVPKTPRCAPSSRCTFLAAMAPAHDTI